MNSIGVDKCGIDIMLPKADEIVVKTGHISTIAANILKQHLLSLGADAAVARWAITGSRKPTDCLITANESQLNRLTDKLKNQPFGLRKLSAELKELLDNYKRSEFRLKARNYELDLGRKTHIMGIVNATPDSFSGDGIYRRGIDLDILELARQMVKDGADIIDIGGESTRPGSRRISAKEEIKRIKPLFKIIAKNLKIPLSVDTYKSEVAKAALDEGASIVNDVSGLRFDKRMVKLVAKYQAAVAIMHMRGVPKTMQKNVHYKSLIDEIISYLKESISRALDAGIRHESIVIDPGIGFGKTRENNLEILNNLSEFKSLGFPILVGSSRKSFIGLTLNKPEADRIMGTAASVALSIANGAHLVRVHDISQMYDVVKMANAIRMS
jgi:dihydropteroate synthase